MAADVMGLWGQLAAVIDLMNDEEACDLLSFAM